MGHDRQLNHRAVLSSYLPYLHTPTSIGKFYEQTTTIFPPPPELDGVCVRACVCCYVRSADIAPCPKLAAAPVGDRNIGIEECRVKQTARQPAVVEDDVDRRRL